MELTPHFHLVPNVLEKSRAIPLLTLRACVAYKKGEDLPTKGYDKYWPIYGCLKIEIK